jgi:hypothetical protein
MRFYKVILIFAAACLSLACGAKEMKPSTPLETLKSYTLAVKRKDTTTMKLLLSNASIQMAQTQANEKNTTLDEIVKNETFFTENPTRVEFRNQKIEGERATIEVKNAFNSWDTVAFVLEEGVWKIDKPSMANQMLQQNELDNKKLDNIFDQGKVP